MARRNGSGGGGVGYLVLGVTTVAAGAALGYFVLGNARSDRSSAPTPAIQEVAAPSPAAPTKPQIPHAPPHPSISSNYTAPGSPRIQIVEDNSPTLESTHSHHVPTPSVGGDTSSTEIPTPDAEASQEGGGQVSGQSPANSAGSTPADATNGTSPASQNTPSGAVNSPPSPGSSGNGSSPAIDAPAGSSSAASSDPESSQTGLPQNTSSSGSHLLYRIQTGAFSSPQDAQTYAQTLSGKGISASVSSQSQNGQTIYKVQVGAYHDRSTAEQAASGLRRQGVPVTISTVTP